MKYDCQYLSKNNPARTWQRHTRHLRRVLFDDLLDVVHKSLREESYPNFVARSQIGIDLAKRLKLAEDAQMRFADKGLHF